MSDQLGARLKVARTKKGLSQTELAQAVGIHYTQVGRYENKGATPAADVLARIANELNVSTDYLVSGTAEELASGQLSDKELLNQFKQIEQLGDQDRNVVKIFLDAFITKKKVQQLAG